MTLVQRLAQGLLEEHPAEAAFALERMPADRRALIVQAEPSAAAGALSQMLPQAVAECLARLEASEAAAALDRLALDHAAAVLRGLPDEQAEAVLQALPSDRQEFLRRLLRYPEGTAGALMDPMAPELPDDLSVAEARVRLRRGTQGLLHYVFVVNRGRVLTGVLEISDLFRARSGTPVRSVMHERVQAVPAWTPAAAVRTHPGWDMMHVLPVTDEEGRLVGALRYETLRRLEREDRTRSGPQSTTATVSALGELFHLGLAGLIEGVATAAAPRSRVAGGDEEGGR